MTVPRKFVAEVGDTTIEHPTMEAAVGWALARVRERRMAGEMIEEFGISEIREYRWAVNYPLAETPVNP